MLRHYASFEYNRTYALFSLIAMTDTSRLDRLEALAERIMLDNQQQHAQMQHQMQQMQDQMQQQQRQLDQNSRDIRDSMVEIVDMLATLGEHIEENSTYIRGLQAENRHILGILLEQRRQDGDNGSNGT